MLGIGLKFYSWPSPPMAPRLKFPYCLDPLTNFICVQGFSYHSEVGGGGGGGGVVVGGGAVKFWKKAFGPSKLGIIDNGPPF